MKIFLETLTGKRIALYVESSESIENVKAKISDYTRRSIGYKGLLFFGQTKLEDGGTIADYNINEKSTLSLFLRCVLRLRHTGPYHSKGLSSGYTHLLSVKIFTGRTIKLDVHFSDAIETIREKIEAMERIPKDAQRLFYAGILLLDGYTVASYGMGHESNLYLFLGEGRKLNEPLLIYVKMLPSGNTITLDAKYSESIKYIKAKIQDKEKISLDQQILVSAGKILENQITLGEYNIESRSTFYLVMKRKEIPIEILNDIPKSMVPFEVQGVCTKCPSDAVWRCECEDVLLCESHRIDHLSMPTDHIIRKLKPQIVPILASTTIEYILREIKIIDDFSNKILDNAAQTISEITLLSNKAMENLKSLKKYFFQLLKFNKPGTNYEEYMKFLNKDLRSEPHYDQEKVVELAETFTNQYWRSENLLDLRFSQLVNNEKKICQKCSQMKEIKYFTLVSCININKCAICITCRIADPIKCIKCYRYYSKQEIYEISK